MKIIRLFFLSVSLIVLSCCANAQTADVLGTCGSLTIDVGGRHVLTMDSTGKACVNATVSATATIAAFAPVGTNNAISVTSTTARTALTGAATNSTTLVENSGATDVFVAFGDNTVTVTAANGTRVPTGWGIAFNIGTATNIAYITASSTSTINATTGTGLPALGAAGSGGSGGSVTQGTSPWVTAPGLTTSTLSGWTSGTAGNATQAIMSSGGWPAITVQLNQTSTISGGAVTFEGTYDGTNWVTIPVAQVLNPNTLASLTNPYTLVQSTNQPFLILTQGYQQVRIRLSTVITGSGTVTPFVALLPFNPTLSALLNPLVAGSAIIGQVGINQTLLGTTNKVVGDLIVTPSASFVRPANATPYASGNLVANSTTAGSVVPMSWTAAAYTGGNFYVRRFRMTLSGKSVTNTSFRLHLFTVTPATITNGDGGALSVTSANEFCQMDVTIAQVGADVSIGYGVPASGQGNECNAVTAAATTIFGLLEARAAYTPTSGETITVIPEIHQN